MPTVSVIIPCYNAAPFLEEAVASVAGQTFQDFEIIIVDDGSTDETPAVAGRLLGPRVRYVRQENSGPSAARNRGIQAAAGDYLAFLDGDDTFLAHKLAAQVAFLRENEHIGLVSGGWELVDQAGIAFAEMQPWEGSPAVDLPVLLMGCPFITNSVLVRREWLARIGGFDSNLRRNEDWDLWIRLAKAGCRMAWQRVKVCHYRVHSSSSSWNIIGMIGSSFQVLDNYFAGLPIDHPTASLKNKAYTTAYLLAFSRLTMIGDVEGAVPYLQKAVELDPGLWQNKGERIVGRILATAASPMVERPEALINQVIDSLPDEYGVVKSRRREIIAKFHMGRFYSAHGGEDWPNARHSFFRAVSSDPHWLRNRGALRMGLDAILGTPAVEKMRKMARLAE